MKQIRKPLALLLSAALALSCGSTLALAAGPDSPENCLSIFAQQDKPAVTVTSNILGLADTGNKTSLKKTLQKTSGPGDINIYYYNEAGKRVTYAPGTVVQLDPVQYTGSALISLGDNIDDSKIDSSQAVVRLVDGNTYHADEFVLSTAASTLNGTWQNGTYTYALNTGDLEWNTWGYTWNDYNSGREWSIMGGDGAGDYFFTFEVSGIRYDGKELDPVTFPVTVYCYGRTVTDLALSHVYEANTYDASYTSGKQQSLVPQWTWYTEGAESAADKPYLNDTYTDYFSVTWPLYVNGADVTAEDVQITLKSAYGDTYTLQPVNAYGEQEYAVASNKAETNIFVTYQQWAPRPVYNKMTICVSHNGIQYQKTYDIASVAAYMVQTGGGGVAVDSTVTCYNYYGLLEMNENAAGSATYTLTTEQDGTTYYYMENADGTSALTADAAAAKVFDANGEADCNVKVLHNVVFVQTRMGQTEQKTVNGEAVLFQKNYSNRISKTPAQIVKDKGAVLDDGFNLTGSYSNWAWTMRYQSGWTTDTAQPTGLPFVQYPYGFAAGSENPVYANLLIPTAGPMGKLPPL